MVIMYSTVYGHWADNRGSYGIVEHGMVWLVIGLIVGVIWYSMVWYGIVWYGHSADGRARTAPTGFAFLLPASSYKGISAATVPYLLYCPRPPG